MFVCLLFLAIQKEPKSLLLLPHFFFHSIVVDESMNTDRPKQTRRLLLVSGASARPTREAKNTIDMRPKTTKSFISFLFFF
jgi:hypothetical protein